MSLHLRLLADHQGVVTTISQGHKIPELPGALYGQ